MLNQVVLTGNLGDDPSSHYTPEGLAITHFNIAFKSSAKKKDANWIKVSCFGKLAEVASTYLHKGARIAVIGILDQNKWQGDEGCSSMLVMPIPITAIPKWPGTLFGWPAPGQRQDA
jgi:single-strand DNA-binding protein